MSDSARRNWSVRARYSGNTAAVIVEFPDNEILLIKRNTVPFKGYWALPEGRLEEGETAERAAIREVKEETGLDIEILRSIGEYRETGVQGDIEYDFSPTCFLAKPIGGTVKRQESEIQQIELFRLEELPRELAFEHSKMISDYLRVRG